MKPSHFRLGLIIGALAGLLIWRRRCICRAGLRSSWQQDKPRTAVVTGASGGIGEAFARRLASQGFDLILIARRRERLERLAQELSRSHNLKADVLVADLADPDDVATVEARLAEVENLELLVNNAGFGLSGTFDENDIDRQARMIQVNVVALERFTHAALSRMIARGSGSVINVSSLAGFLPSAGRVTYGATKAYINAFTEALHQELMGTGVRVQTLCPGFTRTDFQRVAGIDAAAIPAFMWMTAEEVVEQSLRDLQCGRVVCIPGNLNKLIASMVGLFPRTWLYAIGHRVRMKSPGQLR